MIQKINFRVKMRGCFFLLILSLVFGSCTNKKMDIRIEQTACKGFKISNPVPTLITNVSCSALPLVWNAQITMDYSGLKDCIYKAVITPTLYNTNGNPMTNVACTTTVLMSDSGVTITASTVTIPFRMVFQNINDVGSFFQVYAKVHTENQDGFSSNEVFTFIATNTCSSFSPASSTSYTVNSSVINVTFDDTYDHDISGDNVYVSIGLNGAQVVSGLSVTSSTQTLTLNCNQGSNSLIFNSTNSENEVMALLIDGTAVVNNTGFNAINVIVK